jgi:diguanylate cyclase (GGDEF)-like protein
VERLGAVLDRRIGVVLVCALVSLAATKLTGPIDGSGYNLANQVIALGCTVIGGIGAWRHRSTLGPIGWLIFAGIGLQWIGTTWQSVEVLYTRSGAYPNWPDIFYLANYPAMMAAILLIVRRRRLVRNTAALIDTVTVTVGVAVLSWCFLIADIANDSSTTALARIVGSAYPIGDVLMFGAMTRLLFSASSNRGPILFLTGGVGCVLAGDVGYTLAIFAANDNESAPWITALYHLSVMMVALTLWQSDTDRMVDAQERTQEQVGAVRKAALALGAVLAPVTLLTLHFRGADEHLVAAAGGGIVLSALTLIRMSLLVTAVESQSEQLVVLARTDGLTGLANRRTFDFELDRAMREALDPNNAIEVLTIGLLDLDHFKRFNDTHGHSRGDQLLRECAAHWADALSRLAPRSFMARYGGEEFVVIFRGDGTRVAAEILREIMPLTPMEQTFSAGVATWDGVEPALDLLNRADKRLYAAKYAGRKLVVGERFSDVAG